MLSVLFEPFPLVWKHKKGDNVKLAYSASPFKFHQVKIPRQAGLENDKCQLDPVSLCEKQIKDREISLNNNCNKIDFRKHCFKNCKPVRIHQSLYATFELILKSTSAKCHFITLMLTIFMFILRFWW